ncbi:CBS domain-containing protein [Evansella sp. AB-rgal1]|uniref:CBS domain-containing protein n=1 Tax=Evansella sp. AB-rgal1 TaxID=3242696 RepID=UPI00359D0EC5
MPKVEEVYKKISKSPSLILDTFPTKDIGKEFQQMNPVKRSIYVIDQTGKLMGIITIRDLLKSISIQKNLTNSSSFKKSSIYYSVAENSFARDIMRSPIFVMLDDPLEVALQRMIQHGIEDIPVIDKANKVIGDLNAYEMITEL